MVGIFGFIRGTTMLSVGHRKLPRSQRWDLSGISGLINRSDQSYSQLRFPTDDKVVPRMKKGQAGWT